MYLKHRTSGFIRGRIVRPDVTFAVDRALKTNYLSIRGRIDICASLFREIDRIHGKTRTSTRSPSAHFCAARFRILFLFVFCTLCCPNANFPVAFPKESQLQQRRATQPQLIIRCMLGLFVLYLNPPNSDMDYMIFSVRT